MEIPMLEDDEWESVSAARKSHGNTWREGHRAALVEYERITGFRETNFNALFHHRVSQHGPPCPRCGKALRTPVAYKCFECGLQVRQPGSQSNSK